MYLQCNYTLTLVHSLNCLVASVHFFSAKGLHFSALASYDQLSEFRVNRSIIIVIHCQSYIMHDFTTVHIEKQNIFTPHKIVIVHVLLQCHVNFV